MNFSFSQWRQNWKLFKWQQKEIEDWPKKCIQHQEKKHSELLRPAASPVREGYCKRGDMLDPSRGRAPCKALENIVPDHLHCLAIYSLWFWSHLLFSCSFFFFKYYLSPSSSLNLHLIPSPHNWVIDDFSFNFKSSKFYWL